MPEYTYVIVGGGMTAAAAAESIRQHDPAGTVGMIGAEPDPPYNRPPLSKGLWKGEPLDSIWRETAGVTLHLGRRAVGLDPESKTVTDDRGAVYRYGKLLLATGAAPRRLGFDDGSVIYFRTLEDYRNLRVLAGAKRRFAVIGGGFIGWEVAAALAMNGQAVTMLFPEATIGARVYPAELGAFLNQYYRDKGVRVVTGCEVTGMTATAEGTVLATRAHGEFLVDAVVAGIGVRPATELAEMAGLKVDNGIVVDELLRTSHPGIYAAGDVANFPVPVLGRIRVEHEDNANTMGREAGARMAGETQPYRHLPFFYSDLFDLGYEAVGDLDARSETVAEWKEPFREGVVYYLREGRVRGVLLWNVWGQVEAARRLIAEPGPFRARDLRGRLPAAA